MQVKGDYSNDNGGENCVENMSVRPCSVIVLFVRVSGSSRVESLDNGQSFCNVV